MVRKMWLFMWWFIFYLSGLTSAQELVSSRIEEVVLFSTQAQVVRKAKVKAKKGLNTFQLEEQAFAIDKDSISAKIWGEGEIYSVQFKEIYVKEAPQKRVQELKEKIEELEDSKTQLLGEEDALSKQEELLNSIVDFSRAQIPKDIKTSLSNIDSYTNLLEFVANSYTKIKKAGLDLKLKIRDIERTIDVLNKELASLGSSSQGKRNVIEIVFNSFKEQTLSIEVRYIVYNAGWRPFYKVNVPSDLKKLKLVMFAKIIQKSGENWDRVKLTISNVVPLRGVRLPEPTSWFLDIRRSGGWKLEEKEEIMGAFRGSLRDKVLSPMMKKTEGFTPQEAELLLAQKKQLPLSFEYIIPQKVSIDSRQEETVLPLFAKDLKGEFIYYAVPRISNLTFLTCRVVPDKELLSGVLNVYFQGRFIGKTFITEKKPDEGFTLNLGADREVKVIKKKVKDNIKETFFGKIERKTIIRDMGYKIVVENLKDKKIKIQILDNIPVSRTDKIEVKNIKIEPQPKERNYQDKKGLLLWEWELQPNQKEEINMEFTITYPKDTPLVGL